MKSSKLKQNMFLYAFTRQIFGVFVFCAWSPLKWQQLSHKNHSSRDVLKPHLIPSIIIKCWKWLIKWRFLRSTIFCSEWSEWVKWMNIQRKMWKSKSILRTKNINRHTEAKSNWIFRRKILGSVEAPMKRIQLVSFDCFNPLYLCFEVKFEVEPLSHLYI